MGYYVYIQQSTFKLPAKDYDAAYEAMCALNQYDDIKRGGSFGGPGKDIKWFSWMDEKYPETCEDARAILCSLGFDTLISEEGIEVTSYDGKTGQEDLFLEAICPWASGHIVWCGESGDSWMDNYDHMTVRRYYPVDEWVQIKDYEGPFAEETNRPRNLI